MAGRVARAGDKAVIIIFAVLLILARLVEVAEGNQGERFAAAFAYSVAAIIVVFYLFK